jgi:hypothetical protein
MNAIHSSASTRMSSSRTGRGTGQDGGDAVPSCQANAPPAPSSARTKQNFSGLGSNHQLTARTAVSIRTHPPTSNHAAIPLSLLYGWGEQSSEGMTLWR